jgi:excisionase family DNA binding protein
MGLLTLSFLSEGQFMPDTIVPPAPAPSTAPAERDYTVNDLAGRTQSSARHIWRLIDAGRVPGVYRLGRLVRIHRATADAWLAGGCKPCRTAGRE